MAESVYRVLLIEDNDDDADLVLRGIRRFAESVDFTRSNSIPKALDFLTTARDSGALPNLILVDGRIDGVDASDFFQQLEPRGIAHLPCVVLSGSVESRTAERLLQLGANAVRWKPVDYSQFLDEIARILHEFHPSPLVSAREGSTEQEN